MTPSSVMLWRKFDSFDVLHKSEARKIKEEFRILHTFDDRIDKVEIKISLWIS